ncbi:hypothetical protein ACOMHN_036502 [Nucella lapillus]
MAANMNKPDRLPMLGIVWLVFFCHYLHVASPATSPSPSVSTSSSPPTTTTTTTTTLAPTNPASVSNTDTVVGQCPCDVTGNACDVNCCCDEECSDADKQAFSPCLSFSEQQPDSVCFPKELFLFENSDDVRSETTQDSICLYPSSSGDSSVYTQPDLVTTLSAFQEYRQEFSSSSFQPSAVSDSLLNASFYKSGGPIYTVTSTEAVSVLGLPRPLTSRGCVDSSPAAYLTDERWSCVRSLDALSSQCSASPALSAANYFSRFRVVTSPELFQTLNATRNETEGFSLYNSAFTVGLKQDNRSGVDPIRCQDYTTSVISPCPSPTLPSPVFQAGVCSNVLLQVDYTFVTGGSAGISEVLARFVLTSIPLPTGTGTVSLTQTFSTAFQSERARGEVERSGNPGYIEGQPLLAGTLNQTTDAAGNSIDRIEVNEDRGRYMTLVRSSRSGDCVTAAEDRSSLLFGRDVQTGCRLRVSAANLTEFCTVLPQSVISALEFDSMPEATGSGYRDNNRYVGLYGNSSVTSTGDWVKILYQNRPLPTPPPPQTSSCRVSLGLHIQVLVANVGAITRPQPKVIAALFLYDPPTDLQVTVPGSGQVTQAVTITTAVSFLDVSKEAVTHDPRPPIYDAKVPGDFFYPFVTGAASHSGPVWMMMMMTMMMTVGVCGPVI